MKRNNKHLTNTANKSNPNKRRRLSEPPKKDTKPPTYTNLLTNQLANQLLPSRVSNIINSSTFNEDRKTFLTNLLNTMDNDYTLADILTHKNECISLLTWNIEDLGAGIKYNNRYLHFDRLSYLTYLILNLDLDIIIILENHNKDYYTINKQPIDPLDHYLNNLDSALNNLIKTSENPKSTKETIINQMNFLFNLIKTTEEYKDNIQYQQKISSNINEKETELIQLIYSLNERRNTDKNRNYYQSEDILKDIKYISQVCQKLKKIVENIREEYSKQLQSIPEQTNNHKTNNNNIITHIPITNTIHYKNTTYNYYDAKKDPGIDELQLLKISIGGSYNIEHVYINGGEYITIIYKSSTITAINVLENLTSTGSRRSILRAQVSFKNKNIFSQDILLYATHAPYTNDEARKNLLKNITKQINDELNTSNNSLKNLPIILCGDLNTKTDKELNILKTLPLNTDYISAFCKLFNIKDDTKTQALQKIQHTTTANTNDTYYDHTLLMENNFYKIKTSHIRPINLPVAESNITRMHVRDIQPLSNHYGVLTTILPKKNKDNAPTKTYNYQKYTLITHTPTTTNNTLNNSKRGRFS